MNKLFRFFFSSIYGKVNSLVLRLSNVEIALDCLIKSPRYVASDKVGFNGQMHRKQIFCDLLSEFEFDAILETGTWIGNTTGYMAETSGLPVYTTEFNDRFYSLAKLRLSDINNITFMLSDSREFLRKMAASNLATKKLFIYLDAHWYEDLPLEEEIEIICSNFKNYVIMVDDFEVPIDVGYGYDDYGKNKSLTLKQFSRLFKRHGLVALFPSLPSSEESGNKRGCVVLVKGQAMSGKAADLGSLFSEG